MTVFWRIVIGAFLLRCLYFLSMRDSLCFQVLICDSLGYDQWARRIAAGDWLGSEVFYQTPLYPYSIGLLYTLFGPSVWVVRFAQAALSSIACGLIAAAGERFFNARIGLVSGVLLAVYPPSLFFDGIIQKASLDLFLMACLLLFIAKVHPQPQPVLFVPIGAVLGLLILNRENAWVFLPVIGVWIVISTATLRARATATSIAAFGLAMALVLVPVGLRNQWVGGNFLLTTSQMGPNFFIGNNVEADGRYRSLRPFRGDPRYEQLDARLLAEEAEGRQLSPKQVSEYWISRTARDITQAPFRWCGLLTWKAYLTIHAAEIADAEGILGHARESSLLRILVWSVSFGVLVPLATAGLWLTRSHWRILWIQYALMLSFVAAVTLFYVFARYRYPLVPMVTMFAAAGLVGFWELWRTQSIGRTKELFVAAAMAVATAVVCNLPLSDIGQSDVQTTLINVANGLMDQGRAEEALVPLKELQELRPLDANTYVLVGRAYKELSRYDEAEQQFRMAIERSPDHAIAQLNLGLILQKKGMVDVAAEHVRRALQRDPLNTDILRALGTMEIQLGWPDEGIVKLRRATELAPHSARPFADLGTALLQQGRIEEACEQFRHAIANDPLALDAANNLAWILATAPDASHRKPAESKTIIDSLLTVAPTKSPDYPSFLDTLAAAQAATGDFTSAVATLDRAIEMTETRKQQHLGQVLAKRRDLYASQHAHQDPSLKQRGP